MSKKLCGMKKLLKKDPAKFAALVQQPCAMCEKCGRVASASKRLCQPVLLESAAAAAS